MLGRLFPRSPAALGWRRRFERARHLGRWGRLGHLARPRRRAAEAGRAADAVPGTVGVGGVDARSSLAPAAAAGTGSTKRRPRTAKRLAASTLPLASSQSALTLPSKCSGCTVADALVAERALAAHQAQLVGGRSRSGPDHRAGCRSPPEWRRRSWPWPRRWPRRWWCRAWSRFSIRSRLGRRGRVAPGRRKHRHGALCSPRAGTFADGVFCGIVERRG